MRMQRPHTNNGAAHAQRVGRDRLHACRVSPDCDRAPLSAIEALWGPRAYRYAMISAGRLAHRIYLGATALGLGCCGIGAFYDRDASALLRLNHSSALLYMVAAGPIKHQPK